MKGLLLRITIGIFIGITVTSNATFAVPSMQWGSDLYKTCALTKGRGVLGQINPSNRIGILD